MYRKYLRPFGRQVLAKTLPAPLSPRRRIAVAGLPRSGTSWLAKALSLANGVSYYFEPDLQLDERYVYRYLPAKTEDPNLTEGLRRQLKGASTSEYVLAEQGLCELLARPFAHTVLIKWVRLSLMLDWIARRFPELVVVQIIRHPVPQFLSWRARDWDPAFNLNLLLKQPALMEGPLADQREIMQGVSGFWEQAAAFWGAVATLQLKAHRRGWFLLEHEWYCLDPAHRVRWLAEQLGLEWRPMMQEFVQGEARRGPGYGEPRDPRSEVYKWRGQVSDADLRIIRTVLQAFALPFYKELEPTAFYNPPVLTDIA